VWWACILAEGDHRRARVEPWVKEQPRTLRRCIDSEGRPRALAADRVATSLASLGVAARWVAFERARKQSVLRVYDVQGRVVRVATTTAAASVTPEGLVHLGHSKDHRPALPQGTIARAGLDPLGLPLTTTVVAGKTADDPLSLPEMAKIRQIVGRCGRPSVGDGKMAALGTRAEMVAHGDSSGCPRSAQQMPEADRAAVLGPVWSGALEPSAIRLPPADGVLDETGEPVASGCASTVACSALEHSGEPRTWQERRLVVRALAFAARQEQRVRQRGARAVTEIHALEERTHGQPLVPDATAASPAAAASRAQPRVHGLGHVTVTTDVPEHVQRRYGPRPATTVRSERGRMRAASEEAPLAHAVRRLGWRVSATPHTAEEGGWAQGVAASRSAYVIAQGCGRLPGRSLSLTPLCLQDDPRVVGRLCLRRSALRVLGLRPCVVRRTLQQAGTTLTGISPGQPGRQTPPPTTAMMLSVFRGVTLSRIKIDGKLHEPLTPLHAVQKRLLALLEVPRESYDELMTSFSKTHVHSHET
jgi:hypothetical protein